MVQRLRDLDVPDVKPGEKPGIISRLFGVKSEIEKFLDRYDDVKGQIEGITDDLERHKTKLLTDIVSLDKLYDANLDYFRTLEVYIAAGRAKLKELDEQIIPKLAQETEKADDVIDAQKLRDMRAARDDLERRVHDLLLTRQVTMQGLPSIRLVQENDKSLVTKINSTIANTVPVVEAAAGPGGDDLPLRQGRARRSRLPPTSRTSCLKSNAENLADRESGGQGADGARRLRHRDGEGREPEPDRHDRGQPRASPTRASASGPRPRASCKSARPTEEGPFRRRRPAPPAPRPRHRPRPSPRHDITPSDHRPTRLLIEGEVR